MEQNNKRVVIVVNEKADPGRAMNAATHAALGFGASLGDAGSPSLNLQQYVDGSGSTHPNISALSLVVLAGKPGQLHTLRDAAVAAGLPCISFTDTMTGGTYLEQLERTRCTQTEHLDYYAILLFGTKEELTPFTRKFSLYK